MGKLETPLSEKVNKIVSSLIQSHLPRTPYVFPDEWGYLLREFEAVGEPGQGMRRYQMLVVARQDTEAAFMRDMGSAIKFKGLGFNILGGVKDMDTGKWTPCHTVAELLDLADTMRGENRLVTVEKDYLRWFNRAFWDKMERKQLERRHRSMSGPLVTVERR